uniref:Uncharacterized protein n=1 Tax=Lepeophtheirus salmonis TaxID=72036 RepID=A0A0K2T8X9_LEPSM
MCISLSSSFHPLKHGRRHAFIDNGNAGPKFFVSNQIPLGQTKSDRSGCISPFQE